jgi:hypothetical protein
MAPEDWEADGGQEWEEEIRDRLKLLMIRLTAIAISCKEDSSRGVLREVIEQLVQVIGDP